MQGGLGLPGAADRDEAREGPPAGQVVHQEVHTEVQFSEVAGFRMEYLQLRVRRRWERGRTPGTRSGG